MDEELIEKCLVVACFCLLKENEGIVVFVDGENYIIWNDEEDKLLKLDTCDVEAFEDTAMTKRIETIKHGQKVWVHKKPN
jgi:hypothetical protein